MYQCVHTFKLTEPLFNAVSSKRQTMTVCAGTYQSAVESGDTGGGHDDHQEARSRTEHPESMTSCVV